MAWNKVNTIYAITLGTIVSGLAFLSGGNLGYKQGHEQGVQESGVHQIKSAGDLNNDGIGDLVVYNGTKNKVTEKTIYICRESGICVSQDDYLAEVNAEMDYNTQERVENLKKLIEENFEKLKPGEKQ